MDACGKTPPKIAASLDPDAILERCRVTDSKSSHASFGETPFAAVADLWLALNKKEGLHPYRNEITSRLTALGFPPSPAYACARNSPPRSGTAAAGEAAAAVGALFASPDGGCHLAIAFNAPGEGNSRFAVIDKLATHDANAVAIGAIAFAGIGDDQNTP